MSRRGTLISTILLALFLGLAVAAVPHTTHAQDKPKPEDKQKDRERDDNDDDDDKVSPEEARSVKVPLDAARAIALGKVAGKVLDEELERERGRLQYAFDIKDHEGNVFDIEVDAETGEVLQVKKEDEDDEDDDAPSAKVKTKKKVKTVEKTATVVKTKTN